MQPNFTLVNTRSLLFRMFLLLGFIQLAFFQGNAQLTERTIHNKRVAPTQQQIDQKLLLSERTLTSSLPLTQNDAGLITYGDPIDQPRTEAICSVFTGTLSATDPALTSGRLTRDGVASTCATTKTCPGNFSAGSTFRYQTHTFTNPLNVSQCITVTHQNTGTSGAPHLSIHNGAFNPANICTNYLADNGTSPNPGNSVTFSFTIPANATITLVLTTTSTTLFGSYSVTLDGCQPLCSGTPTPGNTVSSANPVCAGVNFTLSLQNATTGAGVTYQWQSAPSATGPWTNVTGGTNSTLVTNQSAATFYRCNVTCGGSTGTSTPLQVTMNPPLSCYCIPAPSDCTDDDMITRVRISTLDNSSTCSANGYANYTTTVAAPVVFAGASNPIIVNTPTVWTDQVSAWIDYNNNGQFEDSEFTAIGSNTGNGGVIANSINIPSTANIGVTRMRVRVRFSTALTSGQACLAYGFGETEDYNVNIQPCVTGVINTHPASTSVTCGNNATFSVAATGSLLSYTWQYRTSATAVWNDITNGGVFSGATTSTLTLSNIPGTFNGYQFRALMRGGCTAVDFSNPATLTVNQIVPVVNPASTTICTGTIQALTLTNSVATPTTATFTASAGLPLAIPDNNTTGVTNSVTVSGIPAGVLITNVAVKFNMTHTWAGDVVMNLKAPNGQTLNLVAGPVWTSGGSTADFVNTQIDSTATAPLSGAAAPRTGRFRADRATATIPTVTPTTTSNWLPLLSTLNGTWTLGICDFGLADLGTLTSWEIQISYVAPVFAQGVWTATPATTNTMFTDAAATIPYTGTPATTIYVRPTVNTNYAVSYNTPTPCTSAVTTVPVSVTNPIVGLAVAPATRAVCLGGNTTYTASVTSGGPITYQWERSIDGGLTYSAISGATSATLAVNGVTQNMTGYRYRVVATAAPCGSVTSNVVTLTVNPLPVVTISSPVVRLVPGRTTTITATSTPAAAPNGWSWTYNGNPISGTTNTQVVNIDQLGRYQATVVDVNGCVNKSNELAISAEPTDKLWIYPNPTVNGAFQVRFYFSGDLSEKRVVTIYNPLGQVIESRDFTLVRGSAPYQRMDFNLGGGATAKGSYVVKVANLYTGKVVSGIILVQ